MARRNKNANDDMQQEMESLIPRDDSSRKKGPPKVRSRAPISSESSTKSGGRMKKRAPRQQSSGQEYDEERVALIDMSGMPTKPQGGRRSINEKRAKMKTQEEQWTLNRLMRYLSLTCVTAIITFVFLRRQAKVVHWEEYKHVLEPSLAKSEKSRCFVESGVNRHQQEDTRCTCPDPNKPQIVNSKEWKHHHDMMYLAAKKAPQNLDIVLLGDNMIERWNGTHTMGTHILADERSVFEQKFTKRGGGRLEGLALGTSGDTVRCRFSSRKFILLCLNLSIWLYDNCWAFLIIFLSLFLLLCFCLRTNDNTPKGPNVLWHLQNGVLEPLKPKVWMILVGMNDLYDLKCTNRFVVANILNVVKAISDHQPDAQFVLHGILPRKDKPSSKSQFLGAVWQRAQAVNLQLRKFCEHKINMHYMQAGPLFFAEEKRDDKGRRQIDPEMMEDGIHPTAKGFEVWGDHIVKLVESIVHEVQEAAQKQADKEVG